MDIHNSDFLVVGGGIAGLMFALRAARHGKVHLLMKNDFEQSSTNYAQGGINAVLGPLDSFDSHVQDTLDCGYGLCDEDVVRSVVERGPRIVEDLISMGVGFTHKGKDLSLHREGGHAHNRVVHAKDATGAAIMVALKHLVLEHPNIDVFKHHMAIDLILSYQTGGKVINGASRAVGVYALRSKVGEVCAFTASLTYLATGGIGKVYPYTTNPRTATGDGIAMAYRAGIEVVNMEFIQFHPTLLYHHKETAFLISEAVRGEGGILRNGAGEAFMTNYHSDRELAPRDVVARAIDAEMKRCGDNCAFLDVTHLGKDHIVDHFPNIYQKLLGLGLDITRDFIPVVPGAHYLCGGLRVDNWGKTSCVGLFAGGECTYTGLHGANRLASNSLLEAAVYAANSATYLDEHLLELMVPSATDIAPWIYHDYSDEYEESLVSPLWKEVRQFMWNYVGIIRTDKRLQRAIRRIESLRQEIESSYWDFRISADLVELRNISIVAEIIIRSARMRRETRGLHYNADHPQIDDAHTRETVISLQMQGLFR